MTSTLTATRHRWDDLVTDSPMPDLVRRRIVGDRMMISEILLHAGCDVPEHAHENEQFAIVVRGRIRFRVGRGGGDEREEMILGGGEVLHLPSNVPHAAHAIEETLVLDVFAPPSEATGIDGASRD